MLVQNMPLNSLPTGAFPQFKEDYPSTMQNYAAFQLQPSPAYSQCYSTPEIPMYSQSHSPPSFSDVNLAYPKSDLYYSMPYSNVSVNPLNSNLAFHPGSFISPYAPPENAAMSYPPFAHPTIFNHGAYLNDLSCASKQFQCNYPGCGKLFKRTEHLKRHLNTVHTDFKPFVCRHPQCHKRFSRSDNLSQHLRTHRPKPNKPHP